MFDKVLLPVDLTHPESWQLALPAARQCAGPEGEIHLLGIMHEVGGPLVASFLPEDFARKAMAAMKEELNSLAAAEMSDGPKVKLHVSHGHVPETILNMAREVGANLIVMASHPPSELKSMLVGSNASKIVRHSPIPVLVVR